MELHRNGLPAGPQRPPPEDAAWVARSGFLLPKARTLLAALPGAFRRAGTTGAGTPAAHPPGAPQSLG